MIPSPETNTVLLMPFLILFLSIMASGNKKRTSSADTTSWTTNYGISLLSKVRYSLTNKTNKLTDRLTDTMTQSQGN
jgi:hypothetical protein